MASLAQDTAADELATDMENLSTDAGHGHSHGGKPCGHSHAPPPKPKQETPPPRWTVRLLNAGLVFAARDGPPGMTSDIAYR